MARRQNAPRKNKSADAPSDADGIEELPFEAALDRLEGVVDRLEGDELELEAALTAFEEGVKLSAHCASQLEAAERRIEVLVREGERWIAKPFESGAGDAGEADAFDEGDGEEESD